MQFSEIACKYLKYCEFEIGTPLAKSTLKSHSEAVKRFSQLFNKDIEQLTLEDAIIFKSQLLVKECSLGYIERQLCVLRNILKYAEERGLNVLPYQKIKLPVPKVREVEYLQEGELTRIFNAIDRQDVSGIRFMAFITSLLDTGMRISEALSLNRQDLNIRDRCAYIIGKGSKKRMVMFTDWSLSWILKYLSLRTDKHEALFANIEDYRNHYDVSRLSPDRVRQYFRDIRQKAGVPNFTPHICRKTFATWLNNKDVDIRKLQLMLGHSSVLVTQRYVGIDWDKLKEIHRVNVNYGEAQRIGS